MFLLLLLCGCFCLCVDIEFVVGGGCVGDGGSGVQHYYVKPNLNYVRSGWAVIVLGLWPFDYSLASRLFYVRYDEEIKNKIEILFICTLVWILFLAWLYLITGAQFWASLQLFILNCAPDFQCKRGITILWAIWNLGVQRYSITYNIPNNTAYIAGSYLPYEAFRRFFIIMKPTKENSN